MERLALGELAAKRASRHPLAPAPRRASADPSRLHLLRRHCRREALGHVSQLLGATSDACVRAAPPQSPRGVCGAGAHGGPGAELAMRDGGLLLAANRLPVTIRRTS